MFELIKSLLAEVWDWIKKTVLAIISFVDNIVSFFRDRNRLRKLQQNQNRIAVAIKEKLKNGDYQVVNCLYDQQETKLVDPEEDAQVFTSEELDAETKRAFGDKNMLVAK